MILSIPKKFEGAIDHSFDLSRHNIFTQLFIKFDTLPTTSENMVLSVRNSKDDDFNVVVETIDPSSESEESIIYEPDTAIILSQNEYLHIVYDNTDERTIGITYKGLDSSTF